MSAAALPQIRRESLRLAHLSAFAGFTDRITQLVCMCVAAHYNDDVAVSWPGIDRIAAYAKCSANTVRAHLVKLQNMGVLELVAPADRPARLRLIRSNTWRFNASALPACLIELPDDTSATPHHIPHHPPVQAAAPEAEPQLIWPRLDTPITYADGYTPTPQTLQPDPSKTAPHPSTFALDPSTLAAPELRNSLTGIELKPQASPRRALPDDVQAPFGTTPQTWTTWQAVRRSKGKNSPSTEAELTDLTAAAHAHYGPRADALELALTNCIEFGWLRFDGAWLAAKRRTTADASNITAPELTPEARIVQALHQRYGLGPHRPETTPDSNRAARTAAMAAYNRTAKTITTKLGAAQ